MNEQENVVDLLQDIKGLLSHTKKVFNIDDLVKYTGLSKSKIYKLSQLKLIPTGKTSTSVNYFSVKKKLITGF